MKNITARQAAAILVREHECEFPDTFDGNMKLQKLLVFANLIHFQQNKEFLFQEQMSAFKHGIVVEAVRKEFKAGYDTFLVSLSEENTVLDFNQKKSIDMSFKIFGHLKPQELSDLHHEFDTWRDVFVRSNFGRYYDPSRAIIDQNDISESDLSRIEKVMVSNDETENEFPSETINGITFYYDNETITMNDRMIDYLQEVSLEVDGDETSYFIGFDEEQGIYIY